MKIKIKIFKKRLQKMKSQGSIKAQKQTIKSEKGKTYNKLGSNYDDQ
jgi:hypothetical protein